MSRRAARAADRGVLDEPGRVGAMTWVLGIMVFLTVLAAALGLGTAAAARLMGHDLAGRVTVQVAGDAAAARVLAALRGLPEVRRVVAVDRAELARLLRPWLGSDGADPELPVPALIDVDLADPGDATAAQVAGIARRASPLAQVDRHERWMSPVGDFMRSLTWLAGTLVLLMASAAAAVAVLAARAGLETHRATIEVMHMLGSTDVQVARLFQRRVAIDAAIGGAVGGAAAAAVAWLIGGRIAGLGSELLGGATLGAGDWLLLVILPLAFVAVATLAARRTVVSALRRTL